MYLIFDTETTGLPKRWNAPITDTDNWPRAIQIAWQLHDELGQVVEHKDYLIRPEGFDIPFDAEKIHGISTELAQRDGASLEDVMKEFVEVLGRSKFIVGQNVGFDVNIVGCELVRLGINSKIEGLPVLDTCTEKTAQLCQIPGGRGGKFKLPNLTELHEFLFGEPFAEAHNATADVEATSRCFFELIRKGNYSTEELINTTDYLQRFLEANPSTIQVIGLKHINLKAQSDKIREAIKAQEEPALSKAEINANLEELQEVPFSHLHNHTQFSILQATTKINDLIEAASMNKMPGVAMTDLGNMMGAFHFVNAANAQNDKAKEEAEKAIKEGREPNFTPVIPIIGCELFVCKDRNNKTEKDNGYQIPLLAKNKEGYHNIAKLSSIGYIEGFYYVPRIDKEVLAQHKENVIATTGGLQGEIPHLILNVGEKQAEEAFAWYHREFGEDFYVELMRHGLPEEDRVNETLLQFCEKYGVKYFAANNTFYLKQEDANAHDILLCVKEGERKSTPIGRGRGYRFGFPNDSFYLKSQDEMKDLFKDLPDAIKTTQEIVDKIEPFQLKRDVLLPAFDIPEEFIDSKDEEDGGKRGENAFLKHLTYVGAEKRYGEITPEIKERLDFELDTIAMTGYPGYFLIVQDFTTAAREMGVSVGPGRGSAAGSAVAYCIGITNVDPIKYDLLFERFLNPDRVSLPDIDIDFDDEGRGRVIDYVINKYGASQVAQIITYGSMAAKSSIRDTGRVLELPLPDTDRIAKLVPDIKLNKLFAMDEKTMKSKISGELLPMAKELIAISEKNDLEGQTVQQAITLEGSLRNTGIHACGVIITPSDIRQHVPVAVSKESTLWCTQFDNSVVENAGLLKMDFLGLKTLTLIKDAVALVKKRHGIDLDPDQFPLDDKKTYELFQRGETVGIFQYESTGMQKYLRDLKPTVFADLIAMNALYRPGPLEYIPSFIRRKHGEEEISYDLEGMDQYLEETYGITVYQEQVMLLSQSLAGFTKGEADMLRKAMGKKIFALLEKLKPKFIEGAVERGHDPTALEKVWKDWEAFASYAFNKSHSTCYAWVAYQTAYLKAHYPAEYMASVLSNNMSDIKSVTFFMEECKRMHIPVLGPDVNESSFKFTVNEEGAIRFGLGGMKGVGGNAVDAIVVNRTEEGKYSNLFDLLKRIDLRVVNKKTLENLALGGAFDNLDSDNRAVYFSDEGDGRTFLEKAIRYSQNIKASENSSQVSLFGEASEVQIPEPPLPNVEPWPRLHALKREKEVNGMYLSSHPLDDFKDEIKSFCNTPLEHMKFLDSMIGKEISVAGIVVAAQERMTRTGKTFGVFTLEDYTDSHEFALWNEDYLKFKHFMVPDQMLFVRIKIGQTVWEKDGVETKRIKLTFLEISQLHNLMDKMSQGVELTMSLRNLDEYVIDRLEEISRKHPGKKRVRINVIDSTEGINVSMRSRGVRVEINKALLDELNAEKHWKVKVE